MEKKKLRVPRKLKKKFLSLNRHRWVLRFNQYGKHWGYKIRSYKDWLNWYEYYENEQSPQEAIDIDLSYSF